eukprot:scaffold8.g1432.t1
MRGLAGPIARRGLRSLLAEDLVLLSERMVSGSLATSSCSSAALPTSALEALGRNEALLARLAPRLFSAVAGGGGRATAQQAGAAAARQLARDVRQVQPQLWRRLFSSEPPRRGWERFYPKGKPRRAGQAKAAKEAPKRPLGEGAGGEGGGGGLEELARKGLQHFAPVLGIMLLAASLLNAGRGEAQEVSFQWFKTHLLSKGVVEKLEVANKSAVKVYVRAQAARRTVGAGADLAGDDAFAGGPPDGGLAPGGAGAGGAAVHRYFFNIGSVDAFEHAMEEAQEQLGVPPDRWVPITYTTEVSWQQELWRLLPTILLIGGYVWFTRRQLGGLGGGGGPGGRGIFNVGKAQVTTVDKHAKNKVTFKDVAGCDEAKAEIIEFVNFLKNPGKYKELGAKIPKGALLVGPPGTGKTLLAKATAGEAGVPFLSISGSDFMEMFVGVGPARVRDLFAQARAQAPSMIFIDEIDAIGRARGRGGFAGGNDERENTLNQVPLRSGREERLAALTPGFAGADIANVCNEAALIAARANKDAVGMPDFEAAVDRVIGGLEKKNKVISAEERRTVAYHEAGHAVVGWFLEHAEPLLKVMLGKISTGAQNDLERVTKMAYAQARLRGRAPRAALALAPAPPASCGPPVAVYGMNPRVGLLSFPPEENRLDKPYSDDTARLIDTEARAPLVRTLVTAAYERTLELLQEKRVLVETMAQALLHKEVLGTDELEGLLGPRPYRSHELRNIDKYRGRGSEAPVPPPDEEEPAEPRAAPPRDTPGGLGAPALAAEAVGGGGAAAAAAPSVVVAS